MTENRTTPLYEGVALHAGYRETPVLHAFEFRIERGEHLALIGPNGAGKTTLLRLLAGDMTPSAGALNLSGRPVHHWPVRERARKIAYVPPVLDLLADLTVYEYVGLGRTPHVKEWQPLRAQDHQAVHAALDQMSLAALAQRSIHALSEGEKHRAMIALALAQEPEILLLDEPTAHLDIKQAWHTMELIDELHTRTGMTLVLTMHDLNLAASFCSRLILIDNGRLVASGAPAKVLVSDQISRVYGYPVDVVVQPQDGRPRVFPIRRAGNKSTRRRGLN